jgi:putative FmdB family regulatory protein
MRLYEYRCTECGKRFEAIVRIAERDETTCPECGSRAERQVSSFALRGTPAPGKPSRCFTGG